MEDVVSFEPLQIEILPPTKQMIKEIIESQAIYFELLEGNDLLQEQIQSTRKIAKDLYAMINTDPPKNMQRKDTKNMLECLEEIELLFIKKETIMLDEKDIQNLHQLILRDTILKNGNKQPGEVSELPKFTTYKGETYRYPSPECLEVMEKAFSRLVNRFRSLYMKHVIVQADHYQKQLATFKICSWFLFEILDLHPFSDANGRVFRVICSFYLSPFGPFPVPIYNKGCNNQADGDDHRSCGFPCKDDYEQSLVDARTVEKGRHPRKLCTMMIYCCWDGWKKFLGNFRGDQLNEQ